MNTEAFALESDMTPIVLDWLRGRGYTCWTEGMTENGCYADILAAHLNEYRCRQRLQEGPVTPWGGYWDCAQRLINPPHGHLPGWYPLFTDTVAVELKLSDWTQAFSQAWTYSRWVQSSYVAMPRPKAEWVLEEGIPEYDGPDHKFRSLDGIAWIGIIAVDPGGCEIIRSIDRDYDYTPKNTPTAAKVVNIAERAWRYWREENEA